MRKLEASIMILLFLSIVIAGLTVADSKLNDQQGSVCLRTQPVWASEEAAKESEEGTTGHEGEASEEAGGEAKEGEGHQVSPPFMYFIQWFILIIAFILGLRYFVKVKSKGKSRHEGLRLAYVLTVLVFVFFALNYYPSIVEYHESGLASFLKFLLLLLTGVLVTFYGVLGRHEEH